MEKESDFVKKCEEIWKSENMQDIFNLSMKDSGIKVGTDDIESFRKCSKLNGKLLRKRNRNPKKFEEGLKLYAKWLGDNYGPNAKKCNQK